jgi:murein peptide amidase A
MVMVFVLALFLATSGHTGQPFSREDACARIIAKLASVNLSDCRPDTFATAGYSTQGMPILLKEYSPLAHRIPQARLILLGGTHGDEYSSISIVFHWMRILDEHHSGLFHWLVLPLLNPDGLFLPQSTRTNARGVDLNRNFPSPGWDVQGVSHWEERTGSNPRYYPGPGPGSETETAILVEIINSFQPQAIISVHAPLNLVDYDGPGLPPKGLGSLPLRRLGNYPGTLGHYAGALGNIPVVTVELASASHMPSNAEIGTIWRDLVRWLVSNVPVPDHFGAHVPLMAKDDSEQIMLQGK